MSAITRSGRIRGLPAASCRVDRDHPVQLSRGVGLALYLSEQPVPGTVLRPPGEPLVDRVPLPEPLRHVPPRRAGAVLPRHAFDGQTVSRPRPRTARRRRHQRLQRGPHLVRDLATRHRSSLADATSNGLMNTLYRAPLGRRRWRDLDAHRRRPGLDSQLLSSSPGHTARAGNWWGRSSSPSLHLLIHLFEELEG